MAKLKLTIKDSSGNILGEDINQNQVSLVYKNTYKEGDVIVFETSEKGLHYVIQLDDAMSPAFVYMASNSYTFTIPFNEKKVAYSPKSFSGESHLLTARLATKEEIASYKNLAKNEYDTHSNDSCYPHAIANVETRGESVFAARNAIDGILENRDHGPWPYASWGINRQDDAEIIIQFGRKVLTDKIVFYSRADFPHDNWWIKALLTFSDNSTLTLDLTKTAEGQVFTFPKKEIEWVKLSNLIKADDPSPFPALSQLEVYGTEV